MTDTEKKTLEEQIELDKIIVLDELSLEVLQLGTHPERSQTSLLGMYWINGFLIAKVARKYKDGWREGKAELKIIDNGVEPKTFTGIIEKMLIVDSNSGAELHRGSTWMNNHGTNKILEVQEKVNSAKVLIESKKDETTHWSHLIVRFDHPSFMHKKVGFINS